MLDWNDIRYLVAVADRGSTLAVARDLGISQTTVARRLAALERATGLTLVDRQQSGHRLTPDGAALLDSARAMTDAADRFDRDVATRGRATGGTVLLSTSDLFAHNLLPPMLVALHQAHPTIVIDIDQSIAIRDLGSGEADIALRSGAGHTRDGEVGRRIGPDHWTLYCSRDYAARHGIPRSVKDLAGHALVGGGDPKTWEIYRAFLQRLGVDGQVAVRQSTTTGMLASIRSGLGIGALSCFVADDDPDLVRCWPPDRREDRVLWLLTHERVRHQQAVRTAIDFLYDRLITRARALNLV